VELLGVLQGRLKTFALLGQHVNDNRVVARAGKLQRADQ
jgi:hypothetical protein